MKAVKQMVHTALRDDATLRTLGAHAATPYGVYEAHFPEPPNFSSGATARAYVTWQFLGGPAEDVDVQGDPSMRRRHLVVSITVWSISPDTIEDMHARIRRLLVGMRGVTLPSSGAEVHGIAFQDAGPDLFDNDFKVYFRAETYRVSFREDVTS